VADIIARMTLDCQAMKASASGKISPTPSRSQKTGFWNRPISGVSTEDGT